MPLRGLSALLFPETYFLKMEAEEEWEKVCRKPAPFMEEDTEGHLSRWPQSPWPTWLCPQQLAHFPARWHAPPPPPGPHPAHLQGAGASSGPKGVAAAKCGEGDARGAPQGSPACFLGGLWRARTSRAGRQPGFLPFLISELPCACSPGSRPKKPPHQILSQALLLGGQTETPGDQECWTPAHETQGRGSFQAGPHRTETSLSSGGWATAVRKQAVPGEVSLGHHARSLESWRLSARLHRASATLGPHAKSWGTSHHALSLGAGGAAEPEAKKLRPDPGNTRLSPYRSFPDNQLSSQTAPEWSVPIPGRCQTNRLKGRPRQAKPQKAD